MPFGPNADVVPWTTDKFTLKAGEEKYLCFAKTLDADVLVNGFASGGDGFVHHMLFARTSAPEPEGFQECGVAFRQTWDPMFISGAGANSLDFPDDAGNLLRKGTQLLLQLHLLNVKDTPIETSVTLHLRRSKSNDPRPVSSFVFGTAGIELPPKRMSTISGTCPMWQSVRLIGGFGHMHLMGSSIRFEVGPSETTLKEVFERDPFSFDNQKIEELDVTLEPGHVARVTCTYANTSDQTVRYGESTTSEMCYFVAFAIDQPFQGGCLEEYPEGTFGL